MAELDTATRASAPEAFGRFWLHEKIGHGGAAEIFRATTGPDPNSPELDLAIKRLLPEQSKDPLHVEMFFTEARIAKYLKHPNIVRVYESGTINNRPYIAMEYVWGFDLATLLMKLRRRRIRLPVEMCVYVAMQVLRALDYVHMAKDKQGEPMDIVHRDVTPSNIYVTFAGEVKLGDFGVAMLRAGVPREDEEVLRGKASYMPPEVLSGHAVDQLVDLWSLAVTLYETLTGKPFIEGVEEEDLLSGKYKHKIVPLGKVLPDVDETLSNVLEHALNLKRRKRPQDAATLYRQLKLFLMGTEAKVSPEQLGRFCSAAMGNDAAAIEPHKPTRPVHEDDPDFAAFETGDYKAPIEVSPTQRYEIIRKKRMRIWWIPGAVSVPLLGLALFLWLRQQPVVAHRVPAPVAPKAATSAAATAAPAPRPAREPAAASSKPVLRDEDWGDDTEMSMQLPSEPQTDAQNPKSFRSLMLRGRTQLARGDFDSAAQTYEAAAGQKPRHVPALLGWARALFEVGKYAEAEKLLNRVIREAPQHARAHFLLGSTLRATGRDSEAKDAFKRAVEVDRGGAVGRLAQQILSAW